MGRRMSYEFLDGIRKMPPLKHSASKDHFDIMESEVVEYMISRPEIRQKLFDMARNGQAIEYDPATKTWRGADYEDN